MAKPGAMLKAILILPFNVLVTIPAVILWIAGYEKWVDPWAIVSEVAGLAFIFCATVGMIRTSRLFLTQGEGTPAPWDPPTKFVVEGPYRHVRNPMISSVVLGLIGAGLVFNSAPVLVWAALFLLLNFFYIKFSEEPGLVERFGEDYLEYRRNVPAWIPRFKPWRSDSDRQQIQSDQGDAEVGGEHCGSDVVLCDSLSSKEAAER